jgi:hypothetical protein
VFRSARRRILAGLLLVVSVGGAAWAVARVLFNPPVIYDTGEHPLDVVVADLNGDGHADVATANREGRSVAVFPGDGRGRLAAPTMLDSGRGATSLAVGDMDGDGHPDLVVTGCNEGCYDNAILIFPGAGKTGFGPPWTIPVKGVPYNVALADLDGDGRLDIATSDYPGNRLMVLLSDWTAGAYREVALPTGQHPIALALADVDGDSVPDLVSSDHGSGGSSVYRAYGDGTFSERIEVETGELPYAIALGQLDGDRIPDLVVAHSTDPGRVSILQGRGDGTFALLDAFELEDRLVFVGVADFDGDGVDDVVLTRNEQKYASLHLNEGDGFLDRNEIRLPAENRIYSLAIADLNRDRRPDLVTVDYELSTVSISLGE